MNTNHTSDSHAPSSGLGSLDTTRRDFLRGASCLLVSFTLAPALTQAAQPGPRLPGSLARYPDIDSWLRINADGSVTIFTGKMELGQGIRTALAQIAADELDLAMKRIRMVMADTALTPNEGYTAASVSIESSGMAIRSAAAEARQVLLQLAADKLQTTPDRLTVTDGTITNPDNQSTTYWDLLGGKRIERRATGSAPLKTPDQHTLVGKPVPRIEIPDIVTGRPIYVQDLRLPGMLHARVLRPPSYSAVLQSFPESEVTRMPGVVKIVRDGSFLAVIATREEQAVFALDRLRLTSKWTETEDYPSFKDFYKHLRSLPHADSTVRQTGNVDDAFRAAARRAEASYTRPYHMHASLGPSCAVAELNGDQLTVWSHTQGPYPLRQTLANLLSFPAERIRVIGTPGSGCYGHNGADDVAADAALLARALAGKPIRLQWSREDEHRFEPYGSVMMFDCKAGLDDKGNIIAWDYTLWSDNHVGRPGGDAADFLVARYLANPRKPRAGGRGVGGGSRNSEPLYDLPNQRIVARAFAGPLRCSALRGLGAYANIFAIESFIDELAHLADADPVEYRLRHLKDPRARDVIEAAAKSANWSTTPRSRKPTDANPWALGRGVAFARYKNYATYLAVIADLEVHRSDARIRLLRLTAAVDSGQVINPDGLANQIEGGMIQSASWTLKEQVVFNRSRVTSTDWRSYPIITFAESPQTKVILLDRPTEPSVGAGEAAQGPVAAAIANAVFAATGKRVRDLPLTPDKILQPPATQP